MTATLHDALCEAAGPWVTAPPEFEIIQRCRRQTRNAMLLGACMAATAAMLLAAAANILPGRSRRVIIDPAHFIHPDGGRQGGIDRSVRPLRSGSSAGRHGQIVPTAGPNRPAPASSRGPAPTTLHVYPVPAGRRVAFLSMHGIETASPDGTDRRVLTDDIYPDRLLAWSPDRRLIAMRAYRPEDMATAIYTLDITTGALRKITPGYDSQAFTGSFSRDGKQLAIASIGGYVGSSTTSELLTIIGTDGSGYRELQATATSVGWSPTGDRLAFSGCQSDDRIVCTIRPDGTDLTALDKVRLRNASWSPNAQLLAGVGYESNSQDTSTTTTLVDVSNAKEVVTPGAYGLAIARLDGSRQQVIDSVDVIQDALAWTPDNGAVVFSGTWQVAGSCVVCGHDETGIVMVRTDGSARTVLTSGGEWSPIVSPD